MKLDPWVESEEWREVVSPANHQAFLETLAEPMREGKEVKRVIVVGGTPIMYDVSD
ncbi:MULTISPECIES: hypothetical protein [unclassified Cryobacterium]|uniref:hypothetical protein n=1 Tax=unclassified Cryobacterium TaxID=2649013 RepID=UPI00141BE7C7|nr:MULTISPECIES: hypothetical protein [unclassified Cryobacterium]